MAGETTKSFMLHYNFPPFSTGEVKMMRGTSRREIGHGALAERALQPLLPQYEDFPYTIRIVSEILESNGSSSMATVCGGSLALMDAGVPMKAPCAGVAMGLIKEGDKVAILTDILGAEDHLGDMDFKVAGTEKGITSIQMDIKIEGLELKIMEQALEQARKGRLHILEEMAKALPRRAPSCRSTRRASSRCRSSRTRSATSSARRARPSAASRTPPAPRSASRTPASSRSPRSAARPARRREPWSRPSPRSPRWAGPTRDRSRAPPPSAPSSRSCPGVEGLLHISELQHGRTEKTEDVVKKGDIVQVKLLEVDDRGRMKLSRKALLPKE